MFLTFLVSIFPTATALISLIGFNPVSSQSSESEKFNLKEITTKTKDVCDILQLEFIFAKPCQNLDSVISDAVQTLVENDILSQMQVSELNLELN